MKTWKRMLACVLSTAIVASTLSSVGFAIDETKPTQATAVTPYSVSELVVNAEKDAIYEKAEPIVSALVAGESQFTPADNFSATTYTAFSGTTLYFYTEVVDPKVAMTESPKSFDDAKKGERIKYNLDFTNIHNAGGTEDEFKGAQIAGFKGLNLNTALSTTEQMQFSPTVGEDASCNVQSVDEGAIAYACKLTDNGYAIEVSLDTAKVHYKDGSTGAVKPGQAVGLDVYVMDKESVGSGRNLYTWDGKNLSWDYPAYNGTILLSEIPSSDASATITVNGNEATLVDDTYSIEPVADYDLQNPQNPSTILNKVSDKYAAGFSNGILMTDGQFTSDGAVGENVKRIDLPNALFHDQDDNGNRDWTLSCSFIPLTDFASNKYTTMLSTDAGQHYILRLYNQPEEGKPACLRICFSNGVGGADDDTCRVPYGENGVEFPVGELSTLTLSQSGDHMSVYLNGKPILQNANVPFNLAGAGDRARYSLGGPIKIGDTGMNVIWESVRFYADALDDSQVKTVVAEQNKQTENVVAYTTESLDNATIEADAADGATATVEDKKVTVVAEDGVTSTTYTVKQAVSAASLSADARTEASETPNNKGGWLKFEGVDFGAGTDKVTATYTDPAEGAKLDFHLNAKDGPVLASLPLDGETEATIGTQKAISGIHDLYVTLDATNDGEVAKLGEFKFASDAWLTWNSTDSSTRSNATWHFNGDVGVYDTGALRLFATGNSKVTAGSAIWRDFVYDATIELESGNVENFGGVLVRTTCEGSGSDAYRGYYFGIRTGTREDGSETDGFQIGKANGSWHEFKTDAFDLSDSPQHKITIKCYGDKMRMYVDDAFVYQITDTEHKSGGVGFRTFNRQFDAVSASVRPITQDEIENEFYSSVAKLEKVSIFNANVDINDEDATVTVHPLRYADKVIRGVTAADNGTATVSEDGTTISVTSENGKATKEYTVVYAEETEALTENGTEAPGKTWDSDAIEGAGELVSQANFTNLDPNRTYRLTGKVKIELSGDAASAPDDTLVLGNSPCVYDIYDNVDHSTGWDGAGDWSAGMYNLYMNGGILTIGAIKAMTPDADGYLHIDTLISPELFRFDPSGMTELKIQGRLEGLANLPGMHGQFGDGSERSFTLPAGVTATYGGYELRLVSNVTEVSSVKVDGVDATREGDTFTVEVEEKESHEVEVTPADENATVVIEGDTITVTAPDGTTKTYTLVVNEKAPAPSSNTNIVSVTVDGTVATREGDVFTVTVKAADTHEVQVQLEEARATFECKDGKIIVTAPDGTKKTYTLSITEDGGNGSFSGTVGGNTGNTPGGTTPGGTTPGGNTPGGNTPGGSTGGTTGGNTNVSTPKNGTATVGGKLTLYKNGAKVTGTKTVTVGGKTYAVKSSVVQTSGKATYKVVKLGKNSYVVNKKGVVQKKKMLKVGKRRYVVNKKGVILKAKKKYATAKVGKKIYIVNKKGYVQMKKKTFKVGKTSYKVGKNGVAKKKK